MDSVTQRQTKPSPLGLRPIIYPILLNWTSVQQVLLLLDFGLVQLILQPTVS
jgi:hypothetical protein